MQFSQGFQRVQSTLGWPHVLGQNIMVTGCDKGHSNLTVQTEEKIIQGRLSPL